MLSGIATTFATTALRVNNESKEKGKGGTNKQQMQQQVLGNILEAMDSVAHEGEERSWMLQVWRTRA